MGSGPGASPFVDAEPTTALPLPHVTWHAEWREPLRRFIVATASMPTLQRRLYEQGFTRAERRSFYRHLKTTDKGNQNNTWHVPLSWVRDTGLRREMMRLAKALYSYELPPEGAVVPVRMLDGHTHESFLYLLGWLRAALVSLAGRDPEAAVAMPTSWVSESTGDGALPLHSDMFVAQLLFNVFNEAVPGEGETTLLRLDDGWVIARDAGMPEEAIRRGQDAVAQAGLADYFVQFNRVFTNDEPWSKGVSQALDDAAMRVGLGRGEGYFVDDRIWLHGRGALRVRALKWDRRHHRLYRMAYNNVRLQELLWARRAEPSELEPPVLTQALMVFSNQ